jgi:NAD(P)-dependent dehydrogenase (short-subunit alcohol dehydrogenase family)
MVVDIRDPSSVQKMANYVANEFGKIDILINNAGVISHYPLLDLPIEEWDKVINTNLRGTFLCVQKIAPFMINNGYGVILNISSVAASLPTSTYAHYGASKAGILQLTKTMALALSPYKIRVNSIQPGTIRTPMNETLLSDPHILEDRLKQIPLGYIPTPEELIGPIVFLVSEDARYITGANLFVDGGSILLR